MKTKSKNKFNEALVLLYGKAELKKQIKRYSSLSSSFKKCFGKNPEYYFSSPGRTEIGGNHTDHNHGRVIAASINSDGICAVAKNGSGTIKLYSQAYSKPFVVDLNNLSINADEVGTTTSLIRGIANAFVEKQFIIGGFEAYFTSDVLVGSGLSSSASIEVLIGKIFSYLFNNNSVAAQTLAMIGQYAENKYFGKPCGLMDQMACAIGGIITIDFENPALSKYEKLKVDFNKHGYELIIIDTGGSHADLTDEYSSIPTEMKAVATILGKRFCREISEEQLLKNNILIRKQFGDRAFLRAFHFVNENARVVEQVKALKKNNFKKFLELVKESGDSSFKWLQNIYSNRNPKIQQVTYALALAEKFSKRYNGVCRVHGGGFAGTIQVFIPKKHSAKFLEEMSIAFSKDSIKELQIRNHGVVCLDELTN